MRGHAQKLTSNCSTQFSGPSTIYGTGAFLPTLGLSISLGWRLCSCMCHPAPGQSFPSHLLQALEETSLMAWLVTITPSGEPFLLWVV